MGKGERTGQSRSESRSKGESQMNSNRQWMMRLLPLLLSTKKRELAIHQNQIFGMPLSRIWWV